MTKVNLLSLDSITLRHDPLLAERFGSRTVGPKSRFHQYHYDTNRGLKFTALSLHKPVIRQLMGPIQTGQNQGNDGKHTYFRSRRKHLRS